MSDGLPRVLVIDDEEDARNAIRLLLESRDYPVDVAVSGAEGVLAAGHYQPEVVVIDWRMPDMNGEMTAESIKRVVPGVRIVAVAGEDIVETPWADSFVRKDRLDCLGDVVGMLAREPDDAGRIRTPE